MSVVRKTAIEHRAAELCSGRQWSNCQPLTFAPWQSGRLRGKSRDDADSYAPDGVQIQSLFGEDSRANHHEDEFAAPSLPIGRLLDIVKFLCDLSMEFGVIWEIRLERFGSVVGAVRNGRCDERLLATASRVEPLSELLDLEPIPSPPFLGPTRLVDTLIDEWGCDLRTVHLQLLDGTPSEASSSRFAEEDLKTDPMSLPLPETVDDDGPTILPFPKFNGMSD